MDRETIIMRSKNLPLKVLEPPIPAEDHQIWEGNEKAAHFKLTKELLPIKTCLHYIHCLFQEFPQTLNAL
jgi:hypothetical protein